LYKYATTSIPNYNTNLKRERVTVHEEKGEREEDRRLTPGESA